MEQLKALEIIALSMAAEALRGTLNDREKYTLVSRIRELTGLPESRFSGSGVKGDDT